MRGFLIAFIKNALVRRFYLSLLILASLSTLSLSHSLAASQDNSTTRFIFKSVDGRVESAEVMTSFTGKSTNPFAAVKSRLLAHVDPKLLRAATIAEERANAHSKSRCWRYVKEALLASGAVNSYPKTEFAREAGNELVSSYGYIRLAVRDPYQAPIGSVLVYGSGRAAGHVEIRTANGFVSDFRSSTPSRRPLIGVYAKVSR